MIVGGASSAWADGAIDLFHETFGDNSGSARTWSDSYSVKSGVSAVYNGITGYTVSNVKQGKNTTGYTKSGLNQSSQGTDAYIIIGPLKVDGYSELTLTYQWKAASVSKTYSTKLEYATSLGGVYTEVSGTGAGATTFVKRSYSLPAAAQVSTLYLKITWNTSNTQGIIDEVILSGVAAPVTHTLTYSATNGTIAGVDASSNAVASGGSIAESATVTLTATPSSGYAFKEWSVSGTGSTLSSTSTNPTTFTMGTADATVTAVFVESSTVATPSFSVSEGTYNVAQSVELDCGTDGATIYYTTDGTDPTASSSVYSKAISVTQTTTIKAFAVKDGLTNSAIGSATYTLKCVAPSFDPAAGSVGYGTAVTLSTTTDGATIYYTTNGDTPTSSSSTYDSSNKPTVTGDQTFKAIATKTGWSNSDVSSAAYTYYYVITAVSNNDSYGTVSGTTTITAVPKDGYRVVAGDGGYTVTSGTATVTNNGDNTFTVEAESNCTVQINFEAIPTHTVTFSVNGNTTRTASVLEGAAISFPTAVEDPGEDETKIPEEINGQVFVGWYGSTYTHASTAPTYVNTSTTTMGASDVTYYAVYATVSEGSYTLDYDNESSLSSSTSWGSYGTALNYTATDGSAWTIKAYKNAGMQVNTGKDCSIKMPSCPGNIQSVEITCSAAKAVGVSSSDYSGSGTITYLAYGTDATSQTIDLSSKTATTGYIVPKSGSTSITKIVVNYMSASAFSTDARSDADISYADAEVNKKLASGYTGQALTNPNSLTVSYSSSNETVATVNSSTGAIIELKKAGSTTITATFAGNATYKPAEVSYTLNVTEKTPHGLAYATDEVEKLTTDAAFTNTLTNGNSLTVSYSSSATDVATVDGDGEVTIKGAGETTITASFDGDEDYEAGSASYTLTVSKANPTLSFAKTSVDVELIEGSYQQVVTTTPADLPITYSSSDETVATVASDGTATLLKKGSTTITANFAGNASYNSASTTYTLNVVIDYATLPFSFDKGKSDIASTTGLSHEGLGSDYASSPKLKFDDKDDYMILKFAGVLGTLSFDIKGNSFSGGTFKVQTSVDGSSYSDLASYTSLGDTKTETFTNIATNVRYIKWIYTSKSSGNVGLGNINLKATMPVTITTAKYATFSNSRATDFSETGITVYKAKVNSEKKVVKLTEISDGIVPASTGVILYKDVAEETNVEVPVITTEATISENDLVATVTRTLVQKTSGGKYNYILQAGPVFNMATAEGAYMPANRAYLSTTVDASASGARLSVVFDDDVVTGVTDVRSKTEEGRGEYFNLKGQRVENPKKGGIYVKNGKKVIFK